MPAAHPLQPRADAVPRLALEPDRIVETIARLRGRIDQRFPGAGLGRLTARLQAIGEQTEARLDSVERLSVRLRTASWGAALLIVIALLLAGRNILDEPTGVDSTFALLQALESGIQDAVFVGVGLAFLLTAESRLKRRRALHFLRELRAVAHIADMHQLTKDPDRLLGATSDTPSGLSREQLGRYLDYCSELLSLTAKLAALHAERFNDPVVLQAVDEVEALTTGLSSKIWQKIVMLDAAAAAAAQSSSNSVSSISSR